MTDSSIDQVRQISIEQQIRVGQIVFPRMDQMDLTGPFAVFARLPNAKVQLLWKNTEPVRDQSGLGIVPDASLAEAGEIDLLVVPGRRRAGGLDGGSGGIVVHRRAGGDGENCIFNLHGLACLWRGGSVGGQTGDDALAVV